MRAANSSSCPYHACAPPPTRHSCGGPPPKTKITLLSHSFSSHIEADDVLARSGRIRDLLRTRCGAKATAGSAGPRRPDPPPSLRPGPSAASPTPYLLPTDPPTPLPPPLPPRPPPPHPPLARPPPCPAAPHISTLSQPASLVTDRPRRHHPARKDGQYRRAPRMQACMSAEIDCRRRRPPPLTCYCAAAMIVLD